jgi:XTP/dITP diphosphohydrolase
MKEQLYFASSNATKIKEAQLILGLPIQIAPLDLPEIQSMDIEKVVTQKVHDAYKTIKQPVIVDDAGVYIDAWNGFPGPLLKFLMKSGGNTLMLKMLENEANRKAEFVSAIGYCDGTHLQTFIGKVKGMITQEVKVPNNKKVDAIFIPDGASKTYAEMTVEEKNSLSHRKKSLELLKNYFTENDIKFS